MFLNLFIKKTFLYDVMRLLECKFDKSIQISGKLFQFFLSCVALPLSMLSTTHYEFDKTFCVENIIVSDVNIDTFVNVEQVVSENRMDFLEGKGVCCWIHAVCTWFVTECSLLS